MNKQYKALTKDDVIKKYEHDSLMNFKLDVGSIDRKCYNVEKVKAMMEDYARAVYFNFATSDGKVFYIDEIRKRINLLLKEEISMSKFCEELNVKAKMFNQSVEEVTEQGEGEIHKIADDILVKIHKEPNHITTQMSPNEITSFNSGFFTGFELAYKRQPQQEGKVFVPVKIKFDDYGIWDNEMPENSNKVSWILLNDESVYGYWNDENQKVHFVYGSDGDSLPLYEFKFWLKEVSISELIKSK